MPASDRPEAETSLEAPPAVDPEGGAGVEERLATLAEAVERLVDAHVALRERAARSERLQRDLAEALEGADPGTMDSSEVADRLRELAEENGRLREVISESRERVERIRSRLILMEDEA